MASSGVLMRGSFLPLLHPQDGLSSSIQLAYNTICTSMSKRKCTGVVAAAHQDNNAFDENDILVKQDYIRQNGEPKKSLNFSGEKPFTPILDTINYPIHMKNLSVQEIRDWVDLNLGRPTRIWAVTFEWRNLFREGIQIIWYWRNKVAHNAQQALPPVRTLVQQVLRRVGELETIWAKQPELERLADELREEIVYTVSKTGGHLSASLGVAEITVALHHVFNSPEDKIIWDVGHQTYPHKILTGRRSRMHTIRQTSGLAGFPKRDESVHDAFGAGHSSTSISAGLGMAVGRELLGKNNHVIAVIGDEAMTAGQAYEAMNNAGFLDSTLIVILNDNKQVSLPTATVDGPAPPVGALSRSLTRLQSSREFRQLREAAKGVTKQLGGQAHDIAARVDTYMRGMVNGNGASLFEELGLYHIGPVDGHNMEDLVHILKKVKSMPAQGPVLVHIITEKGKGYPPAEASADKMHGVVQFEPETGKQLKSKSKRKSYTNYFAEALIAEAEQDDKIVAIHAAMGGGTGLNLFQKRFPDRCFDVGIAEQHAVTFAAGLATEVLKPFCAIYSSFLQRGYDQVVHDVDLQKLPVRFAMDRAGLVGADGPTHCGAFDTTYMACLPNMVVMAPSDEAELMHMIATATAIDDRPSCFRYPRGNGIGAMLPPNNKGTSLEIGNGRILREGTRVAILGYGTIVQNCLAAAQLLQVVGIPATVADARFCKPLDGELIRQLAQEHEVLVTVEDGTIGGFSSHVSHFLGLNGLLDGKLKWRAMMRPDRYIDHGAQKDHTEEAGLTPKHIAATMLSVIDENKENFGLL